MAVVCPRWGRTWAVALVVVMMMGGMVDSMDVVEVPRDAGVQGEEGVAVLWGIADTTASVGRLFRYHIPGDAFKGQVDGFEVLEAGKDTLPSWLHFNAEQNVLQGIPTPADAGHLYLQVTARGPHGNAATDVFSLAVSADTATLSSSQPLRFKTSGPKSVRCKREEPETVATLVLDADLDLMPVERRLSLLSAFLAHMGLGEEMVKVVPASGQPLHDDSALVTGTGDARGAPQHVGVSVSWLVGCGKVESGHFPALHRLDDDSSSGVMGSTLGFPVLGWRVTNTRLQQQQHALKRRRRQVRPTATAVITIAPPTDTDADTMTRYVVDMSSPVFSIEPSPALPVMPETTTPDAPTTTPKMDDGLKTSREPPVVPPLKSTTEALPPTQKPTEKPVEPPVDKCVKPKAMEGVLKKQIFFVGEVINFRIPQNLFDACGMGGTDMTKLSLYRLDPQTNKKFFPEDWFMKFDQREQTILGMPMQGDEGRYPMVLVAMLKTHDFVTKHKFEIVVRKVKGRKSRVNHELSMTIDADYDEFVGSVEQQVDLASKVAGVFGDENTSALTVTRIARGSVVYAFTNNTLAGGDCPVDAITGLADKMVTADGNLNPEALEKLKPWVLTGAATAPAGDCEGNPDFPVRSASVAKPPMPDTTPDDKPMMTDKPAPTEKPDAVSDMPDKPKSTAAPPNVTGGVASAGKSSDDNIWITTVVPAVVIVAILLIALLVACILYRKKRKGKMNLEEQNTFVNKGAPVIFPDELDDKPSDSTKPLLIEGSPPAPPPEYHRGDSEGSDPGSHKETTPPTDEVDAEIEIDATSPLYQPPPPVPASSGKQARPHVPQPYRSQPPEIHP
ncbi:dystroglycan 1-like [Babylonia areolata]|uniref:dystroglycan 1-like n=1 Tax=Babylonia areolata TaxID=304850 RepID=UPI003FD427D8